jgi:putative transposase
VALTHDDLTELLEMVRASGDVDVVRASVEMVLQALIEAEATEVIGAAPNERTETRTNQRLQKRPSALARRRSQVRVLYSAQKPCDQPARALPFGDVG